MRFTDWAHENAAPFRDELERASQALAVATVEYLFGSPSP